MQQRPVNREINNDFTVWGLPFQALLLVLGVVGLLTVVGQIMLAFLVGALVAYLLRRFLKDDVAAIDWLFSTFGQKRHYAPGKARR